MIFYNGLGNVGKTTFAQGNAAATLLDMIISSALFGSVDDFGRHSPNHISAKSNGLIPSCWIPEGISKLDSRGRLGESLRPDGQYYLISRQSSIRFDNGNEAEPDFEELDRFLTSLLVHQNITPEEDADVINVNVNGGTFNTLKGFNDWIVQTGKTKRFDRERRDFFVVPDDHFYYGLGCKGMMYFKKGNSFYANHRGQPYWYSFVSDRVPLCVLVRKRPYSINPNNRRVVANGKNQEHVNVFDIVALGYNVVNPMTGLNYVTFAIRHDLFSDKVLFTALPYINVAENGPRIGSDYIYGIPVRSRSTLGYTSAERIQENTVVSQYALKMAVYDSIAPDEQDLEWLRNSGAEVVHTTGVQYDKFNMSLANATYFSQNFEPLSQIYGDGSVNGMQRYDGDLSHIGNSQPIVVERIAKRQISWVADKTTPSTLILRTNRCFIDSIIDVIYSGNESALPGGISKSVIFDLISTQRCECIGIYSPLDADSERSKDPLGSLVTEAHVCGLLYLAKLNGSRYFNFGAITTRVSGGRRTLYKLCDPAYIYGNYVLIRKNGQIVADDDVQRTNVTFDVTTKYSPYQDRYIWRVPRGTRSFDVISGSLTKKAMQFFESISSSHGPDDKNISNGTLLV